MASIYIAGTGFFVPEERITNPQLIDSVATTEEWISTHIGIRERRRARPEDDTSALGAYATENACSRLGWNKNDLDLLVCATSTPDTLIPATASWTCKQLEINPVAFDVNAACSGFVYGLAVAQGMMQSMNYKRVAMVTAEKYTRVTDYTDRKTCVFFGDSAGTLLLTHDKPAFGFEVVDIVMENMNEGADCVTTPTNGFFRQDGPEVKKYALKGFTNSASKILGRNNLTPADLLAFVGHQANYRVLQTVCDMLGVQESQHWHNVRYFCNQGAAGAATTFCQKVEEHAASLSDGDYVLSTTFGSGFTTGSALLRCVKQA